MGKILMYNKLQTKIGKSNFFSWGKTTVVTLHIGFWKCEDAKHPYKKPVSRHSTGLYYVGRGTSFFKALGCSIWSQV